MDTTGSSNGQERRSVTPQPQQPQTQQQHDLRLNNAPSHRPIGGICDPIQHKMVHPATDSVAQPSSRGDRGYQEYTILPSSEPPRTPSPQTLAPRTSSNQAGTFANFQLPNDILKNLTPIIKSPPKDKSKQLTRRKAYIRNVQLKVNTKNNRVRKQLKDWKRQQSEYTQYQSAKLTESLQRAKLRRDEYLRMVKEKAVRFVKVEEDGVPQPGTEKSLLPPFLQTSSLQSQFWPLRQDAAARQSLVCFQKLCKEFVYKRHVAFLQNSGFLSKFKSMPFNQILICFNTESSIKMSISFILKHLGIVKSQFELKMFHYSFIMIADFNDCMLNGPHPGFNYNSEMKTKSQEKTATAKNCIWVLLYKLTSCLLQEFEHIIDISPRVSQKLWKYWNDYKFIFKIFKWNHFVGIKHLLCSSISIVEEQISRISDDEDLHNQRNKLNLELSLLNKYDLETLKEFNESLQATQFTSSIYNTVDELYTNFGTKSPSFIQNQSNVICFDLLKFYLPDFIGIDKWRRHWLNVYLNEFESNRSHPSELKTGYLGEVGSKPRNVDYINLVDSLMDLEQFSLTQTYEILYDYYLEFSGVYSLPGVVDGFDGLKKVQNLINHYDKQNKLAQFKHSNMDDDEILQLKYTVIIMWLQKCQFNKFDDFANFENLYTIINLKNFKNLRFSIYTQNPNLLFPEFYKLIMKFSSLDVETQLRNIVYASFKNNLNKLFRSRPNFNQEAFNLFTRIFNHMIVDKEFDNELSATFRDNFSHYHTRLTKLVEMNSLSIMFHSYTGGQLSATGLESVVIDLDSLSNKSFVTYYKNHGKKIRILLLDKWQDIMNGMADGRIALTNLGNHLQPIFAECTQDMVLVSLEIYKFNQFLYKTYNPILNWIYEDVGTG
ncbi:hypothetical protein CANMA_005361 [Candida margitis]|uniref:uncharacterized protein n=1 Tax=Candida margitis TaxID=1775924 RepID=UPI002226F56F|nr:uncharacterized protein CANMA_005361 [Candida margitis]KAI5950432.1 hypothetical protein CANMA_005361 [Candida margitis]